MIDNPYWPILGRTAASRVAQILAHHANFALTQVPYDLGLPLAACLEHQPTALIVAVASADLALCAAAIQRSLLSARADALLIADEQDPWFPPRCAVGCWQDGAVRWYQPLLPWSADHDTMWLVPADQIDLAAGLPSIRLVARYLKPEPMPWTSEAERLAGLNRAAVMLRRGGA